MATSSDLKPWGRFKLVSKDPADECDHIYFYRTETKVGRSPQRAHAVVNLLFISGVHCVVKMVGQKENGDPTVMLQDHSRNGIFINEVRIDKDVGIAEITDNVTVHFTKPGLSVKGIPATVYRFELLRDGLTPENALLRIARDAVKEPRRPASARAASAGSATPSTPATPATPTQPASATGKRPRRGEDTHVLEEMEIEVTMSTSGAVVEPTSSGKRRRMGANVDSGEEQLIVSTKRRRTAGDREEDDISLPVASAKRRRPGDRLGADIDSGEDQLAATTKRRRTDEGVGADVRVLANPPAASTKRRRAGGISSVGADIDSGEDQLVTSAKRQRTSDQVSAKIDADEDLLASATQFRDSNVELRLKLSEAADREAKLKTQLIQAEHKIHTLGDELTVSVERHRLAENEAQLKGERLTDREKELEQLQKTRGSLETQIEELQAKLVSASKIEAAKEALVGHLRAEREKVNVEMEGMATQLNEAQTKHRQSEEKIKALHADKQKLALAVDAAQTRSTQFEESKRGVTEETDFLRMKLTRVEKLFKDLHEWSAHGIRMVKDERSIISPELEALKNADQLISSGELSQPTPTQENYFPDTQPVDGDDEEEQTMDQDAEIARAGLVAAPNRPVNSNPFESEHSRIEMHQSLSMEMHDEMAQPLSSFSTEPSSGATEHSSGANESSSVANEHGSVVTKASSGVNETRVDHLEGPSGLSESTMSSKSLPSKTTPEGPPLKRRKVMAPRTEEETKGDNSDGDAEDEKEKGDAEKGVGDGDDDDAEDTALPDDEEVENDKENTLVMPVASDAAAAAASAKSTPPLPPGPQQGWLQMIVSNDDDKSEQVSASEGGGIFDDETQLSDGE